VTPLASLRGLIQAMSSPMVVTFQPLRLWRRDEHGEVGLAAGRREGGSDVMLLALGRFDAEDQHVLGHPAVIARHVRGNAQGQALLAEQRVAAVAGTVGPDFAGFGIMDDVLGGRVARPARILLAGLPWVRRSNARRE
jgi:hypothetical protein